MCIVNIQIYYAYFRKEDACSNAHINTDKQKHGHDCKESDDSWGVHLNHMAPPIQQPHKQHEDHALPTSLQSDVSEVRQIVKGKRAFSKGMTYF